jgi:hypothetical protein
VFCRLWRLCGRWCCRRSLCGCRLVDASSVLELGKGIPLAVISFRAGPGCADREGPTGPCWESRDEGSSL